jgi:hypothetical protein
MTQFLLLALSGAAIYLVGNPGLERWGCLLGLCAQPFWVWTSWRHRQWGVLVLSFWYAYAWAAGLVNHWRA